LPAVKNALKLTIQPHGVVLLKLKSVNSDEQNQN
jgi:hypothetical protein